MKLKVEFPQLHDLVEVVKLILKEQKKMAQELENLTKVIGDAVAAITAAIAKLQASGQPMDGPQLQALADTLKKSVDDLNAVLTPAQPPTV